MDYYNKKSVGKRIKMQRKLLGITQEEIAKKLHMNANYYSEIECGICGMSLNTLIRISKELDLSLDFIVYGEHSPMTKLHLKYFDIF